jgi:hypothetical protein
LESPFINKKKKGRRVRNLPHFELWDITAYLYTKSIIVCTFIVEHVDPQIYNLINFAPYFMYWFYMYKLTV